jgi:hypothetical protein
MSEYDPPFDNEAFGYYGQPRNVLRYTCRSCQKEIEFWMVEYMSRIEDDAFTVRFRCPCVSHLTAPPYLEVRYKVHEPALRRLLGGMRPRLPYHAAEKPALALDAESERQLRIFGWECEQLLDVDEFLLFCARRRM